jgi:cytochrome b6-f complex iron-sulfur subunit
VAVGLSRNRGNPSGPGSPGPPPRAPEQESAARPTTDRRSFLKAAWIGVGIAALGEAAWVLASFLKPRRERAKDDGPGLFTAGPLDAFATGSVTAFPAGRFYLVRLPDGGLLALSRQCTHLGCSVPWDEEKARFVCPCHASVFDIRGDVLAAPAPRALDTFPVRVENGVVKVDLSAPRRRSAFDASQVVRG